MVFQVRAPRDCRSETLPDARSQRSRRGEKCAPGVGSQRPLGAGADDCRPAQSGRRTMEERSGRRGVGPTARLGQQGGRQEEDGHDQYPVSHKSSRVDPSVIYNHEKPITGKLIIGKGVGSGRRSTSGMGGAEVFKKCIMYCT